MASILHLDVLNKPVAPSLTLDRRRRLLSTIVAKHAPADRPFISVHRDGDPQRPDDGTVRLRKQWVKTLVGPGDTVIITRLPLGGGSQGAKQIGGALALLALTLASGGIASGLFGVEGLLGLGLEAGSNALQLAQGGIVIGNSQLIGGNQCRH